MSDSKAQKREYDRAWRAANPTKVREQHRAWCAANRESIRQRDRANYTKNIEKRRESSRRSYAKNVEKKREQKRQYRAKNGEKVKAQNQAYIARNREKILAQKRAAHAANPERNRNQDLKKKFGITAAQYDAMLAAQGGVCAVCGAAPRTRRLAVDHCHKTGMIRGILCNNCNQALGHVKDNSEILRKLILYLGAA